MMSISPVSFKVVVQNEPEGNQVVEFETVADPTTQLLSEFLKEARFKFNDIQFKASCDKYKNTAMIRLLQDDKVIKESRANERYDVPPEELLGKDEDYISPPPRHQPSKKPKFIDGNGKEIEMPKNAYMHFCLEHRGIIKGGLLKEWRYMLSEFPDLTESAKTRAVFGNTTKRLSLLWSFTEKDVKEKYNKIAADDKKRFDIAMASNPMNAILLNEEKELKANNLKRKNLAAPTSNVGYLNEVEYLNELMGRNVATIANAHLASSNISQGSSSSSTSQMQGGGPLINQFKKRSKPQKLYDLHGAEIKKPLTSYFHFCAQHRARVAEEVKLADANKMAESASFSSNADGSSLTGINRDSDLEDSKDKELPGITKVVIKLGEMWRALTPEEKMVYDDLAAKDKLRFETAVQSNPNNEWAGQDGPLPSNIEMGRIASFATADEASRASQYQLMAFQQQQQQQHQLQQRREQLHQQQRLQQLQFQQRQQDKQLQMQHQFNPHREEIITLQPPARHQPSHEEQLRQLQLQLQLQQQQYQQQLQMLMNNQPK